MKKTGFIFFGIVLYLLLITGTGIYIKVVSNVQATTNYVYANVDIPKNTTITADMIEARKKTISFGQKYSLISLNDAIGKVTKVDIFKDEMLLSSRLSTADEVKELSLKNADNRKFTLKFETDQAVGWCLDVDQYVDMLFVPNPAAQYDQKVPSEPVTSYSTTNYDKSKIVRLEKVRIAGLVDESGQLIRDRSSSIMPKYIVFEVTEEQDSFLAWAKGNGRIELSAVQ